MTRGEVWWANLPRPSGRRPVVLLSREEAYAVRELVTVALVTTRVWGIDAEVPLGAAEGLPHRCVVNLDTIQTIARTSLERRISVLPANKIREVDRAVRFALGLED